jgi:hypothetical protein
MFEAFQKEVPRDAVILARKPTTIALFTGRSATVWGLHADDPSLLRYMARTHVHYILQERFPVLELNADPNDLLTGFVSRNAPALVPVFTNDWYVLYRLR